MSHFLSTLLIRFLASGPGTVAAAVVSRTPGIWRRLVLSRVMPPLHPAGMERLRALVQQGADPALIQFSMGVAFLERGDSGSNARALACLRTAEFLDFEGVERIGLYRAILAARMGDVDAARAWRERTSVPVIHSSLLTELDAAMANPGPARTEPDDGLAGTVVLLGDEAVVASHRFSRGRLAWVSPKRNGLQFRWLASLGREFDHAIGTPHNLLLAREAGVRFQDSTEMTEGG